MNGKLSRYIIRRVISNILLQHYVSFKESILQHLVQEAATTVTLESKNREAI